MTGKKGTIFMEMNILVRFFLTKPYKNELAMLYLWSQDFLWWKIILVGKLTGCCEIYPFELSSAMSGDVVTEYTLWRTLLGKYCLMIYFVSHLPLWLYRLIFCLTCMPGPPLCRTYTCDHRCLFYRWHFLSFFMRWTCTVHAVMIFFSFFCYFFLFFSLMCWFDCFQYIEIELLSSFVYLHLKEYQICFDA